MRRGLLIFVAVLVVTSLVSHLLVIRALPTIIMNRGTAVIADLGVVPNQWFIAPRITAENSAVVRASPDLGRSRLYSNRFLSSLLVITPKRTSRNPTTAFSSTAEKAAAMRWR